MSTARCAVSLLLLSACAVGCSDEKSFVVVSVFSSSRPISNVAQLRVTVRNGMYHQELLYPETPRATTAVMQLDASTPVTFSVSFRPMFKGDVTFEVEALDPTPILLGSGTSTQTLNVGQVTYATVRVAPTCDPMAPATTCGANQTCAVACDPLSSRAQITCFASGVKQAGESCTDLTDCAPGMECSDFGNCAPATQPIKTCRRFCQSDLDCGAGSACNIAISCGTTSTPMRICSSPCDPTGTAVKDCAAGLYCFIYGNEITDCACPGSKRTGGVGVSCTTDEDCQPGLMCVNRGAATSSCQTICRLAGPATCPGGTTCTQLTSPVYRVFGACL